MNLANNILKWLSNKMFPKAEPMVCDKESCVCGKRDCIFWKTFDNENAQRLRS